MSTKQTLSLEITGAEDSFLVRNHEPGNGSVYDLTFSKRAGGGWFVACPEYGYLGLLRRDGHIETRGKKWSKADRVAIGAVCAQLAAEGRLPEPWETPAAHRARVGRELAALGIATELHEFAGLAGDRLPPPAARLSELAALVKALGRMPGDYTTALQVASPEAIELLELLTPGQLFDLVGQLIGELGAQRPGFVPDCNNIDPAVTAATLASWAIPVLRAHGVELPEPFERLEAELPQGSGADQGVPHE